MSRPTITGLYSGIHTALQTVARTEPGLTPFDVRLLVALAEREGIARTDELEQDLHGNATAVRRSSLVLRERGLITADAGEGTDRPRRGTRARLKLTDRGWQVAMEVLDALADRQPPELRAAA